MIGIFAPRGTAIGLAASVLVVLANQPAAAIRVEIVAARDNTLFESSNGSLSSGVGPSLFAGRTGQPANRRALLAFDLSAIPGGASIDSVELVMHVNRTSDQSSRSFALHRVTKAWGEGTSNSGGPPGQSGGGGGAPATSGDATWLHNVFPNQTWSNQGGDFDPVVSASASVGTDGTYHWKSTPQLVADVRAWHQGQQPNNGWVLIGAESTSHTARRFDSRESPNAADRPTLVVHYNATPVEPWTWSAIKATYR
jgi:hypothetical protein